MASSTNNLVINELLCYVSGKFGKLPAKTLKQVLYDFYLPDEISAARDLLVDHADKVCDPNWPKPPRRKQLDSKVKNEIDDVIGVFTYMDENIILSKLPSFVAKNLDNIPSSKIEDGELHCVLNKLDKFEMQLDKLNRLEELDKLKVIDDLIAHKPSRPAVNPRPSTGSVSAPPPTFVPSAPLQGKSWADRAAALNFNYTDDTDTDTMDCTSANDGFQTVIFKKRRRMGSPNDTSRPGQIPPIDSSVKKPKPKTVIGSNASCSLKAAKELLNKRVFCISNVSDKTTCQELQDYIESCGVKVLSIFEAKTKFKDSHSFRVCINSVNTEKFIADSIWGSDIIVREWVFKGNNRL